MGRRPLGPLVRGEKGRKSELPPWSDRRRKNSRPRLRSRVPLLNRACRPTRPERGGTEATWATTSNESGPGSAAPWPVLATRRVRPQDRSGIGTLRDLNGAARSVDKSAVLQALVQRVGGVATRVVGRIAAVVQAATRRPRWSSGCSGTWPALPRSWSPRTRCFASSSSSRRTDDKAAQVCGARAWALGAARAARASVARRDSPGETRNPPSLAPRGWWRWKSKAKNPEAAPVRQRTIALIRRMAEDNRLWGAESAFAARLLKLGVRVAKANWSRGTCVACDGVLRVGRPGRRFSATTATRLGRAISFRSSICGSADLRVLHRRPGLASGRASRGDP